MYRQVTLTALRAMIAGKPIPLDRDLGYSDVLAAWNYYLAHDNQGRGVVLVGHSQGSGVLTRLIKDEIDGKPVQSKLLSAILMGTSLPVPRGADVGGAFKHIPVCRANSQTGCVIAFADFRANAPPPANSRFGKAPEGMQPVCANPAALGGGSGMLNAYLSAGRISTGSDGPREPFDWTTPAKPIDTAFVKVPGLLSAECLADEHGSYLAVTVHPTPGGVRTNEISGDVLVNGQVLPDWGLHLIDANLTMGNLVAIVGDETKAYLAKGKKIELRGARRRCARQAKRVTSNRQTNAETSHSGGICLRFDGSDCAGRIFDRGDSLWCVSRHSGRRPGRGRPQRRKGRRRLCRMADPGRGPQYSFRQRLSS
jgi:hypothetical protein